MSTRLAPYRSSSEERSCLSRCRTLVGGRATGRSMNTAWSCCPRQSTAHTRGAAPARPRSPPRPDPIRHPPARRLPLPLLRSPGQRTGVVLHVDDVVPVVAGGATRADSLPPACEECNLGRASAAWCSAGREPAANRTALPGVGGQSDRSLGGRSTAELARDRGQPDPGRRACQFGTGKPFAIGPPRRVWRGCRRSRSPAARVSP